MEASSAQQGRYNLALCSEISQNLLLRIILILIDNSKIKQCYSTYMKCTPIAEYCFCLVSTSLGRKKKKESNFIHQYKDL